MAFRKRNVVVGKPSTAFPLSESPAPLGVRPSPLTSHPITSTGTPSLDGLLGGHAGLALGSSLLLSESGTTDFSGTLLRYFAAEGICQEHYVHIVGPGEGWVRELPGVAEERSRDKSAAKTAAEEEKMKIAWRYERLGQAGERGALSMCEVSGLCSASNGHCLDLHTIILFLFHS
jgi:elongator complex protein 4